MGLEIVYCYQCKKRLSENDFHEEAALRIGSQTACRDCSEVLLAQMTAEEQKTVFEQSRITASSRKPPETTRDVKPAPRQTAFLHLPPPPLKKKRPAALIAGIGAAALALIIVILAVVLRGGTPPPRDTRGKTETGPGPGDAVAAKETGGGDAEAAADPRRLQEAADALRKARDHERNSPADHAAIIRLYEVAAKAAEGTRHADEALRGRDEARYRCRKVIEADVAELEKTIRNLTGAKNYGNAFARLEAARRRHEAPEWGQSLARLEKEIEGAVQGSLVRLSSSAAELTRLGNAAEAKTLRNEVVAWGIPKYVADFDKALAEAARGAPPLPVTPAASTSAGTMPDPVAVKPEPPPRPEPKPEPQPEPVAVQQPPVPPPPPPPPALPELWALLTANKAKLAGKAAPVKLAAPLDKATALVDDVTESTLVMSATIGGGRIEATKKAEDLQAEELKKLLVLAGVAVTPALNRRLADLVAERERAKAAAACAKEVEAAKGRMEQKDWKGAVAILEGALRLKPGDPEAAELLAEVRGRLSPQSLALDLGSGVTMEFVYIKPGTFIMGGDKTTDSKFEGSNTPKHPVTITKGYYLGKYEVTQAQYQAIMGKNPSRNAKGPNQPADSMGWAGANEFCKEASEKTGRQIRLPTEAEWEFACRAGSDGDWGLGADTSETGVGHTGAPPVGQKKPNAWGLYDMHGSVIEYIADLYDPGYYANSPKEDPKGPTNVKTIVGGQAPIATVLLRGGSCSQRTRAGGYGFYPNWGFRAAMTAPDGGGAAGR
jgi:formylglycine-generating enzyme required for sulfatase activity